MNKPNIVFFLSDQHNSSVMGNAGDPYVKTPNLDNLAANGIRFANTYTNCPVCVPARMALLSGQLPIDNGVLTNQSMLDPNVPTYAHSMTVGGYQTVLAGRMHMGGFDQYVGNELRLTGDVTALERGIGPDKPQTPKELQRTFIQHTDSIIKSGGGNSMLQNFDDAVTSDVIEFLDKRDDERPLMITVGYISPHPPYIAHTDKFKYYYNLIEDAYVDENFEQGLHPAVIKWRKRRNLDEKITKEDWKRMRAAYYANVEFMDENIGKIIDTAKEKLGENTIFVYASDHGESMGINNMVWKTTFYESSVKIPMIVSGANIKGGRVVEELTCLNDLTRTFIDYGKGPELQKPYGQSLKNVLEGNGEIDEDRSIISQIGIYGRNPDNCDYPSAMIRKGDYKLISYYGFDEVSLFNLKDDPYCARDLRSDKDYDKLKNELLDELNQFWDGEKAYRRSIEVLNNYLVLVQWGKATKNPIAGKFYNGLTGSIENNWAMDAKDV